MFLLCSFLHFVTVISTVLKDEGGKKKISLTAHNNYLIIVNYNKKYISNILITNSPQSFKDTQTRHVLESLFLPRGIIYQARLSGGIPAEKKRPQTGKTKTSVPFHNPNKAQCEEQLNRRRGRRLQRHLHDEGC